MTQNEINSQQKIFLILLFFLLGLVSLYWRYKTLSLIGPFTDHAFYTQWIKRLVYSSHFFPSQLGDDSFLGSLIADEKSFLNIFFRQIYTCQQLIFTSIATLWLFTWAQIIGASMESQILISILTTSLFTFLLSFYPFFIFKYSNCGQDWRKVLYIGILIFFFSNTSYFITIFSALGRHNIGVLFLILAIITNTIWVKSGSFSGPKKITFAAFVSQILAVYSSYANIFILPTATFLYFLLQPETNNSLRLQLGIRYSIFTIISFLPVFFILMVIYVSNVDIPVGATLFDIGREALFDIGKGGAPDTADPNWTLAKRVSYWIFFHRDNFSTPGFMGGLIGLTLITVKYRFSLPLLVIFCHFLTGSIMTGFYLHKTAAYSLPLLCLGFSFAVFWGCVVIYDCLNKRKFLEIKFFAAILLAIILPITHLVSELPRVMDTSKNQWGYVHHIKNNWAPIVRFIEQRIPSKAQFIAWDYPTTNTVLSLIDLEKYPIFPQRPLSTLNMEHNERRLKSYINSRNLTWHIDTSTYVLAPGKVSKEFLEKTLLNTLGPDGFDLSKDIRIQQINQWQFKTSSESFYILKVDLF